jgi:DNA sulfur modification protein DndC
VNIIGRGHPPPNRTFRWCTQRMKIDPVNVFVKQRLGHWGEAVLHLGARRAESATRAQTMSNRETRSTGILPVANHGQDGRATHRPTRALPVRMTRHPDLPRVWVSNPIKFLTTEDVLVLVAPECEPRAGLIGDNRLLYKLYASASNGECPIQIDTSIPSCGNSRFGCWTCTVVDRDKASEGLLASGDERMERLIDFRETLLFYRAPANGKRDRRRMNGNNDPGPIVIPSEARNLALSFGALVCQSEQREESRSEHSEPNQARGRSHGPGIKAT